MGNRRQVALIMDVNKAYDRKVVLGIAGYVRTASHWGLYVEEEPLAKMPNLRQWRGHGILADFDDVRVAQALRQVCVPVVGVGGAFGGSDATAPVPFVATDNRRIGELGAEHLLERGFQRFAYCGVPRTGSNPWVRQRAEAFERTVRAAGFPCATYTGRHRTPRRWESLQRALTGWLAGLDRPLGLMACNDARARHVLEACRRIGARVPDDVAVIGVDNDELMCELADPPLSSVIQGTDRIGYEAARLLDQLMGGEAPPASPLSIEPVGIAARRSTDVLAAGDDLIRRAVGFIRERIEQRPWAGDVATHFGLGRSTLDQRFKAALGHTAHDAIERAQMTRAQQLLRDTDLPLRQVAERAGYNTVQYMIAVFRRKLGQTPGRYRAVSRIEA